MSNWATERARAAMDAGWHGCNDYAALPCDCDVGATDGCKARRDAIATALRDALAEERQAIHVKLLDPLGALRAQIEAMSDMDAETRTLLDCVSVVLETLATALDLSPPPGEGQQK